MIEMHNTVEESARHKLPAALLHDMRTPLSQIIGYSEMIAEQAEETGHNEYVPSLQKIRGAGYQLLAIITESFQAVGKHKEPGDMTDAQPAMEFSGDGAIGEMAAVVGHGSLLVVDDTEENRDVLARRLESQGYTVTVAVNGRQALEILQVNEFDLVLLDIMMPEVNGYEVLQRVKADPRLKHIPVIMISALSELDSVARCIELGAEDYLPKPFNGTLLKARIGSCLEKKRAHDSERKLFQELQLNYEKLQALEKNRTP